MSPERTAIVAGQVTWTYRELHHACLGAIQLVRQLTARQVPVGIVMVSAPETVAALLACEAAGRAAVLFPGNLAAEETAVLVAQSPASQILVPGPAAARWPGRVLNTRHPHLHLSALVSRAPALALPPGIVQLTSGSLGASKFAVRTWTGVQSEIAAVIARLGMTGADRVLCASSIAHSYGLIGGLLSALVTGSPVSLLGPDISDSIETFRPTVIFGLARTYELLLDRRLPRQTFDSIRRPLSAGAPLPGGLFDRVREETGLSIRQDYGTTETGTIAIDDDVPARPDFVGRPLDHMEVRMVQRPETALGEPAAGEIQVRSPAVSAGYAVDGRLVPCVDEQGWYHTHDLGWTVDGRLGVRGRLRSPIPVGHSLVQPELVEQSIMALPGIREAVVLRISTTGGSGLKAVVASDLDSSTIHDWCRRSLPAEYQPAVIEVRDILPRSPAGKILQKYMV